MEEHKNKSETPEYELPLTAFPGQEVQLYCPGYECTERGVRTTAGKLVCLHPIMPVEAGFDLETGEQQLRLAYYRKGSWFYRTYPSATLASSAAILELAAVGIAVTSENARALSTYLLTLYHLNEKTIRSYKSVSRLGWFGEEEPVFVPYAPDVVIDCPPEQRRRAGAVEQKGSLQAWLHSVKPLWEGQMIVRLTLAASFASALVGPMRMQPFFVHIWGKTGLGKTLLLQLAASVWGDPAPGRLLTTYHSTQVGLEMNAAFLHDIPLCIDELQIAAAEGKTDFQHLIYMLAEGVGKTRGAKEGGLRKQYTWSNLMLSTGERPLNSELSGGGALNRCIEMELMEPVTGDFAALAQAVQNNFGDAGELFIKETMRRFDCLHTLHARHKQKLTELGVSGKQAAAMALLLTADDIAGFALMDTENAVPPLPYDSVSLCLRREEDLNTQEKALEYLFQKIVSNPAHFAETTDPYRAVEVWGKPVAEYTAVIGSEFDRILREGGFDPKAALHYAYREGLLQTNDVRMRKAVRFGSSTVRCVVIRQPESFAALPDCR